MMRGRPNLILIAVWFVTVVVYGYITVRAKLALPPSGDLYANTWSFQALSFVAFKLPALVALLLVVLAFRVLFSRARASLVNPGAIRLFRSTAFVGIILLAGSLAHYIMTATVEWNPWYQREEQLVLRFMLARLPLLAVTLLLVLGGEIRWLRSRAR
ncbi:MAG TPA: hypothetical protein VFC25_06980 [Verrucomicrobiae bacterium]|nr:hypothetical protein [Verrucomicrobiae bacterium]